MACELENVLGSLFVRISKEKSPDMILKCADALSDSHGKMPDMELELIEKALREFAADLKEKNRSKALSKLSKQLDWAALSKFGKDANIVGGFYAALYELYSEKATFPTNVEANLVYSRQIKTQPIRFRVHQLFERKAQPKDYYNLLHERQSHMFAEENYFLNLKGMSSSTPILYNSTFHTDYSGGGFYVKWKDTGIVVDPGYGFVRNMARYGLTIYDVNVVIITHDHIDHNSDMRQIIDLSYQMHNRGAPQISWYVDAETAKALQLWLEPDAFSLVHNLGCVQDDQDPIQLGAQITLTPFRTRHILKTEPSNSDALNCDLGENVYVNTTFGFVLDLFEDASSKKPAFRLGYTSDTSFFPGLEKSLNDLDLLVANISSVYSEELVESASQNPNHLGLAGIVSFLMNVKKPPRILALSEFWSGIADIRYDISKYIGEYLRLFYKEKDWIIVPLESGTSISLPSGKVQCSLCKSYHTYVHMLRPKAEFDEILFACDDCVY